MHFYTATPEKVNVEEMHNIGKLNVIFFSSKCRSVGCSYLQLEVVNLLHLGFCFLIVLFKSHKLHFLPAIQNRHLILFKNIKHSSSVTGGNACDLPFNNHVFLPDDTVSSSFNSVQSARVEERTDGSPGR